MRYAELVGGPVDGERRPIRTKDLGWFECEMFYGDPEATITGRYDPLYHEGDVIEPVRKPNGDYVFMWKEPR